MVDWRCNFIQSIDSHKTLESSTRGANYKANRLYSESIEVLEHKELQQQQRSTAVEKLAAPSSSNTGIEALILDRELKYILNKGLAELQADQSTTEEDLPVGSTGAPLSNFLIEF